MSKLGDALGFDMGGMKGSDEADASDPTDMPPMSEAGEKEKPKDGGSAELMAMKMFSKATSPEAKVTALKAFLEACGAIGSDY